MISYFDLTGYKSISTSQRISFSGLTVLAGTNSSGKSSAMQPLLLLKQTMECPYDPGAILLDGPNVKITASDQVLSKINRVKNRDRNQFTLNFRTDAGNVLLAYRRGPSGSFVVDYQKIFDLYGYSEVLMKEAKELSEIEVRALSGWRESEISSNLIDALVNQNDVFFSSVRDRCFLKMGMFFRGKGGDQNSGLNFDLVGNLSFTINRMLHVPGLRGNPERTYRATQVGDSFPGTFENYVASILWKWQQNNHDNISALGEQLRYLGLTWKVMARKIQDTRVELKVGRTPYPVRGGARDLVNLADVGLGVAQILPVLVALLSAKRGQVVYVEQPELHLHPKAQWKLADLFRDAVNRGVNVIVETHSSVFLRGIQTQIALSRLEADKVKLNWFERSSEDGGTLVRTADPDKHGAFGDWPIDFDEVILEAEEKYLDAAMSRN